MKGEGELGTLISFGEFLGFTSKEHRHIFSNSINFYFIDDYCQYWLNEAQGTLTSPNYGLNDLGFWTSYDHNLDCTWILIADILEIQFFQV